MPSTRPCAAFEPISPDFDVAAMVESTPNFEYVIRIQCDKIEEEGLETFEKLVLLHVILGGKPLVIEGYQSRLDKGVFGLQWLRDNYASKVENARDLTKKTYLPLTVGHYLNNMPSLTNQWNAHNYKDPSRQRIYLKDIDCPRVWQDELQTLVPLGLFYLNESTGDLGGIGAADEADPRRPGMRNGRGIAKAGDLMSNLPPEMRAENLMCYIGHEGTYTPAHREMCASLGQNIMVETSTGAVEDGKLTQPGSSIWFMTESKEREVVAEYWLSTLGHDIEVESHFAQINAWKAAPFKTYIVEQRVGDFILIPPLAPHQVWNRGTRTVKVAWNRTTVETLEMALNEALPNARMVCRDEQYKNKAIIYFTLNKYSRLLEAVEKEKQAKPALKHQRSLTAKARQLHKDFRRLQALLTQVLLSESFFPDKEEPRVDLIPYDSYVTCSYCRCNIFNRFLTCPSCVGQLADGEQDTYDICMDCYAMGRSCACISNLRWVEQFPWGELTHKHEYWRQQIIRLDGSVTEKTSNALSGELERRGNERTLAQICQLELDKRPWRDITKSSPPLPGVEHEKEVDVDANGNLKRKRKIRRPEKFVREHKACHVDKHWEPKWKQAECSVCGESFCYGTLFRGYDMMPQDVMANPNWECPKCLNICSCRDCRKKPRNKAYTPNGTRLGHNTKAFADPRSVESLVDFSYSNLSWIQKIGDDTPHDTRRLKKRIRAADKAKQQGAALGENYVENNAMDDSDSNGIEDSTLRLAQRERVPIDPSLKDVGGSQAEAASPATDEQCNENPEEFTGFRNANMQIPMAPQFVVPAVGAIRDAEHVYDTSAKITYDYPDPEMSLQTLPVEPEEVTRAPPSGRKPAVALSPSHIEMANQKRKRAKADKGDRLYSYKKGSAAKVKTKSRRSLLSKLSIDRTKLTDLENMASIAQHTLDGIEAEHASVISSDLRVRNAEWNSAEGPAPRNKAHVEGAIIEDDDDEFTISRRHDRRMLGLNAAVPASKRPRKVMQVKAGTYQGPLDEDRFGETTVEKPQPRPQGSSAILRVSRPDSENLASLSTNDFGLTTTDGKDFIPRAVTDSEDESWDTNGQRNLKRLTDRRLSIRGSALSNQKNPISKNEPRSEDPAVDVETLSLQPNGGSVNATTAQHVQNDSVSNAVPDNGKHARLAPEKTNKAKAKAKAITAAHGDRMAKLATLEWTDEDSESMTSEAWSGSGDESTAPMPRMHSFKHGMSNLNKPFANVSHSYSMPEDLTKAVPLPTASAADWGESTSDEEPQPTAGSRRTISRGRPF